MIITVLESTFTQARYNFEVFALEYILLLLLHYIYFIAVNKVYIFKYKTCDQPIHSTDTLNNFAFSSPDALGVW